MKLKNNHQSGKDYSDPNHNESPSLNDINDKDVYTKRGLKGDRRTEGLELAVSELSNDEFSEYFKQFEKEPPSAENDSSNNPAEKWEINDYQILYRNDAEFSYLAIIYIDQQDDIAPTLYAFRDESDNPNGDAENPMQVQNIHGADVHQSYLERGWDDITKSEDVYPWVIKSWLAQHMKQDTI